MDIMVKINVPNYVYRFYQQASQHVANCTTEDIMADALTAYAGLLSDEVSRERQQIIPKPREQSGN